MTDLLVRLREVLTDRFSDSELRTLVFDLHVEWEDLPGETRADKARELVAFYERQPRDMRELVDAVNQRRPGALRMTPPSTRKYNGGTMVTAYDQGAQWDRMAATMEEIRRDVGRLTVDVEVVKSRLTALDTAVLRLEERIAHLDRPVVTWQTWLMLGLGMMMSIVMILVLMRLAGG